MLDFVGSEIECVVAQQCMKSRATLSCCDLSMITFRERGAPLFIFGHRTVVEPSKNY